MTTISVIIRTFTDEDTVRFALESLTRALLPGPTQVIVGLDGGSKDETRDIVTRFVESATPDQLTWHLVYHPHLTPFRALEHLLRSIEGDYVFFLDADNRVHVNRFIRHTELGCGAATCSVQCERLATNGDSRQPLGVWPPNIRHGGSLFWNFWGNLVDINNVRLSVAYTRNRLLPLFSLLPPQFDWLFEDHLIGLVSAMDGQLDFHAERLVEYFMTGRNLTARVGAIGASQLTRRRRSLTRQAFRTLLHSRFSSLQRCLLLDLPVIDRILAVGGQ